jgi:hypothetical protein
LECSEKRGHISILPAEKQFGHPEHIEGRTIK